MIRKSSMSIYKKRIVWAYAFIALPFLYFVIIFITAMFQTFSFSVQDYVTIRAENPFVGLDNYKRILDNPIFLQALKNTLKFTVVRVPILVVVSLLSSMVLHSITKAKGFFRTLFFIPFLTSGVAISWVFKFMYLPNFGVFTKLFDFFQTTRVDFLGNPNTALYSIIAVSIWSGLGYYTLIFLAGIEEIPEVFYDAAKVDGASAWQRFRHVTVPLLNRTIVLVVILSMISSLQNFTLVRMLSKDGFGGPLNSTVTMSLLIYKEAFFSMHMGRASAMAVIFFLIILVLTLIQRRLITREFEY
jgi:multiple sugar transport system permease protein